MAAKILIVDDEPDLLRLTGYALHLEGFQVITATTGAEALRKIPGERPDVAIVDLMLPDINGTDLCRELRGNAVTADLPIMILSARAQVADKVNALQAGADEYVSKPVDSDELVARVKAMLKFTDRMRQAAPPKPGRVLGFLGTKGGVGTTTVALNAAVLLAQKQRTVIVAEIRPSFGTFSLALKHPAGKNLSGLLGLEASQIGEREVSAYLFGTQFGPKVLFGPQEPEAGGELDPAKTEAIIERLSCLAELVVLDLPTLPSPAVQAAVHHCHSLTLVVEPEPTSVAAGRVVMERLRAWGVPTTQVGAIIVNRANLALALSLADVRAQIGCNVLGIVPQAADACATAHVRGIPLAALKPDQLAVRELDDMASTLLVQAEGNMRM